jgi:phage RecT family recombinase
MNHQATVPATADQQAPAVSRAARLPEVIRTDLSERANQLASTLPGHISPDRFIAIVHTAIISTPDIQVCTRRSIVEAALKAAKDGLVPDGREAAFVRFNVKNGDTDQWEQRCQYMPMVYGIIKKVRQSGDVKSLTAHVVYRNDEFDYVLGDEERLVHKPTLGERGEPVFAYAIARLKNGELVREIMTVDEINRVRAVSKSKNNGPWANWWSEMARKTAIRRLSKYLPMSAEVEHVIRADDDMYSIGEPAIRPALVTAAEIQDQAAGTLALTDETGDATAQPDRPSFWILVDADGQVVLETPSADDFVTAYCANIAGTDGPDAAQAFMLANMAAVTEILDAGEVEDAQPRIMAAQQEALAPVSETENRGEQVQAQDTATTSAEDGPPPYEDGDPGPGAQDGAPSPWLVLYPEKVTNGGKLMPYLQQVTQKADQCRSPEDWQAFSAANRANLQDCATRWKLAPASTLLARIDKAA